MYFSLNIRLIYIITALFTKLKKKHSRSKDASIIYTEKRKNQIRRNAQIKKTGQEKKQQKPNNKQSNKHVSISIE